MQDKSQENIQTSTSEQETLETGIADGDRETILRTMINRARMAIGWLPATEDLLPEFVAAWDDALNEVPTEELYPAFVTAISGHTGERILPAQAVIRAWRLRKERNLSYDSKSEDACLKCYGGGMVVVEVEGTSQAKWCDCQAGSRAHKTIRKAVTTPAVHRAPYFDIDRES